MGELIPQNHQYPHVVRAVFGTPWAIQEEKLRAIIEVLNVRAGGFKFDAETIAARLEAAGGTKAPPQRSTGLTAVIPIFGVIQHRMDMLSEMSGGTSTQVIGAQLRAAVEDDRIRSIVFEIDSPGGSVPGVAELADEIFAARGKKPMTVIANTLAASAAYWLGSQADEFVVTTSGMIGSIGVYGVHQDVSQALENEGVKTTIIQAGKYKTEGNPYQPLTDEAAAQMQHQADSYYGMFIDAVARGRGVSTQVVRDGYGQGRALLAKDALKEGMVDRIATFDQVIGRHGGASNVTGQRAEHSGEELSALARINQIALGRTQTEE